MSLLLNVGYNEMLRAFKVPLGRGDVYMRVPDFFELDTDTECTDRVLIIDSKKFIELWKNDPYNHEKHLAFGNKQVWESDYKFHHAKKGFSFGISNPVPLAYVHCDLVDVYDQPRLNWFKKTPVIGKNPKKIPYCSFTNGITRTIWLLANGAMCFPVLTDENSYRLLKKHAGIKVP